MSDNYVFDWHTGIGALGAEWKDDMSVDIALEDADGVVSVPVHMEGAICVVGGSDRAEMSITYNYSGLYRLVIPDYPGLVRLLDGKRAGDVLPVLNAAVEKLGTDRYKRDPDPCPHRCPHCMELAQARGTSLEAHYERQVEDYWAPTPGNAGYALSILAAWAQAHPDATFTAS